MSVVKDILKGSVLAMAKLIRDVDDAHPDCEKVLRELFPHSGKSHILGVTGLAGAGKSTLISLIISHYRKNGKTVGVISVDPSSPFSGGAILGDRIRMAEHNSDPDVFIKSVATRGASGGLSASVADIVHVLEAGGKDVIIVETVGVGQDEIDIFKIVQQVLVVMAPGLGDDIQAIKAGVLEIADIFVVNKSDLEGSARAALELEEAARDVRGGKSKPIVLTDAIHGDGIDKLLSQIETGLARFDNAQEKADYLRRRYRFEIELKVRDELLKMIRLEFEKNPDYKKVLDQVNDKKIDPYTAVKQVLKRISMN